MLEKHRATLTDGRIEWAGEAPKGVNKNGPLTVDVIVVSPQPELKIPDGKKMAAALRALADRGGMSSNPSADAAEQHLKEPNGQKLMAILQRIADRGGIASIKDPVKWQREIRKDRPLPGRE